MAKKKIKSKEKSSKVAGEQKQPAAESQEQESAAESTGEVNVVKMRFPEDKFYGDLEKPKYLAGEIYTIEGADQIQRWVKRGGEIVEGTFKMPEGKNEFPVHEQSMTVEERDALESKQGEEHDTDEDEELFEDDSEKEEDGVDAELFSDEAPKEEDEKLFEDEDLK